jgi:hypothetical protein
VKSTRLASEAQVKSRLFPKTRSWFALGAPLELLSPLSVLRIVYALLLVAWPVTAGVVGTTTTNRVAVAVVEGVTLVIWIVMVRIRNIGLRTCRLLMGLRSPSRSWCWWPPGRAPWRRSVTSWR